MQLSSGKSELIKKERRGLAERLFGLSIFRSKTNEATSSETEEARELLECINNTKREWTRANMNFEYADCQESIDYYSYIIKANEVMYEYLIKKAKEKGIKVELSESIEFKFNKNIV